MDETNHHAPGGDGAEGLLERARGGDTQSLIELLEIVARTVRPRIASRLPKRFRSVLELDDVMQVTYIEAVTRIDQFRSGGVAGFTAWVGRLAENNLIDAIRSLESAKRPNPANRVRTPASADSMVALVEMLGGSSNTPSRDAARDEGVEMLEGALERLPEDYRRVVTMYDLEGQPIEEVASALGRSTGAAYMLRARAHDRLRQLLGPTNRFFTRHS